MFSYCAATIIKQPLYVTHQMYRRISQPISYGKVLLFSTKRSLPRSPAARNRNQREIDEKGVQEMQMLDRSALLSLLTHPSLYNSAKSMKLLSHVSFKTFKYLVVRLVDEARNGPPTAHAARRISQDVDAVFAVSRVAGRIDPYIFIWAAEATATAGASFPILFLAIQHLKAVTIPLRTPILDRLEMWATTGEDPRAIILHSKVLIRREQYHEALALMEKVMRRIYPTRVQPDDTEDVTLSGWLEPPWQIYAWLKEKLGDHKTTDEIMKMAALKYQDPRALVDYAHLMMTQGDTEKYEECMNKAATSGHPEACRKLANYYLLIFLGRILGREQRQADDHTLRAKIAKLLTRSRTSEDYRKLSLNWYELASAHGSDKAAFILSILLRESGHSKLASEYLAQAESSKRFPRLIQRLKDEWNSHDFHFDIPKQLLDT